MARPRPRREARSRTTPPGARADGRGGAAQGVDTTWSTSSGVFLKDTEIAEAGASQASPGRYPAARGAPTLKLQRDRQRGAVRGITPLHGAPVRARPDAAVRDVEATCRRRACRSSSSWPRGGGSREAGGTVSTRSSTASPARSRLWLFVTPRTRCGQSGADAPGRPTTFTAARRRYTTSRSPPVKTLVEEPPRAAPASSPRAGRRSALREGEPGFTPG